MALDVNVVQTINPSIFFWTRYFINAVDPPMPTATPTTMPTAAPTQQRTIYGIAAGANLTLARLADAAGLASDGTFLDNADANWTLMMPSATLFAALPDRMLEYLSTHADSVLRDILLGHLLAVEAPASVVSTLNGESVTFENGQSQEVRVANDGSIFLSVNGNKYKGETKVIGPDVYFASNGVIHEIDRILGLPTIMEYMEVESAAFLLAANIAGILGDIEALSGVTLFAPTFAGLRTLIDLFPELVDVVLKDNSWSAHMKGLFFAHVLDTIVMAENLMDGNVLVATTGENVTVSIVNDTEIFLVPGSVDGTAPVIMKDVLTTQGVVHSIDAVVLPPWLYWTLVDVVKMESPTLANLVEMAGLGDDLLGTGLTGMLCKGRMPAMSCARGQ